MVGSLLVRAVHSEFVPCIDVGCGHMPLQPWAIHSPALVQHQTEEKKTHTHTNLKKNKTKQTWGEMC